MDEHEVNTRIAPGVCATLWTPGSMLETLTPRVRRILLESCPQIACLHGMPESLQIDAEPVWKELVLLAQEKDWRPRLWIGVSCDTTIRRAVARKITIERAVQKLWSAASIADSMGAELVCWDAESACKTNPTIASEIATSLIQRTRLCYPSLVQAHTAYYVPTYHSETDTFGKLLPHGYPWTAWCGPQGVDVDLPQVYVAPTEPEDGSREFARPYALRMALHAHRLSWIIAQNHGWIRKDLPVWLYGQLHHVPCSQTITYGSDPRLVQGAEAVGATGRVFAGWAVANGYCDLHGEIALRVLSALTRRAQTVEQFQESTGLEPDGIAGRETLRALGLELPAIPS